MSMLYSFLCCLLLIALGIVAIPFAQQKKLFSRYFFMTGLAIMITAGGLYQLSTNHDGLQNWFSGGEAHYQLMEKFNELGGIDGAIKRIEEKLAKNPNDAAGWVLLGKLYISKQDKEHAKEAFEKAHGLEPADVEASRYYDLINQ
jgi:cytochrome c-type biogenesis protein CcmH/NrfG